MISKCQQNLKNKTRKMKSLAAELNMYQAQVLIQLKFQILILVKQVNEYRYEIDKLRDEIKEVNRKYYEQKKREKLERELQKVLMITYSK